MRLCERTLERHMQQRLAAPVVVGLASFSLGEPRDLTPPERLRYQALVNTPRIFSWVAGRAALKHVLASLGESKDTSQILFPHPRLSLTHSGDYAVAIGLPGHSGVKGLGIDFEVTRNVRPEMDRFFLTPAECDWMHSCTPFRDANEQLRLWTVKEAVFKANPNNYGTLLTDYCLADPPSHSGSAFFRDDHTVAFLYASVFLDEGIVSAAISQSLEVTS